MPAVDICFLTATELARKIRARELSSREVLEAHLAQLGRVNPSVNAVITLVEDTARQRALELDESAARGEFAGPLHGLPIAHKDLVATKGIRTTFGSPLFQDYVPNSSALLVKRIQGAGAVTIGKTNTPEFGAGSQTFNPIFGATKNPWDVTKTCGGSSGGAAVALACGMVPIADGSDLGGSLRNPASFCSVVGLRLSPGRVPEVPSVNAWNPLSVLGPMARCAQDVALLLAAMAGPHGRAPLSIHEKGTRFLQPLDREMRGVRIAWARDFAGLPFDSSVLEVFDAARGRFEDLGCVVEDTSPDFGGADEAFKTLRALHFYEQFGALHRELRAQTKATVQQEIARGEALTGPEIARAETLRMRLYTRFASFMAHREFLVLPAVQVPPFDINRAYVEEIAGQKMESYVDWMRSCYYISVTGHPAASVPAGFTRDGLPVGIQIVGRQQADFAVLQMAHAFEKVSPARGAKPPIIARLP